MNNFLTGNNVAATLNLSVNGVLTDATTITATITDPYGNQTTATPVKSSTGVYVLTFNLSHSGLWSYRVVSTGSAAGVFESTLYAGPSKFGI